MSRAESAHSSVRFSDQSFLVIDEYRVRLNFRGTKLLWIANLLNNRRFYFHGCWERIDMVYHLIPENLRK